MFYLKQISSRTDFFWSDKAKNETKTVVTFCRLLNLQWLDASSCGVLKINGIAMHPSAQMRFERFFGIVQAGKYFNVVRSFFPPHAFQGHRNFCLFELLGGCGSQFLKSKHRVIAR